MTLFLTGSPTRYGDDHFTDDNGFLDEIRAALQKVTGGRRAPRVLLVSAAPDDRGFTDSVEKGMGLCIHRSGIETASVTMLDRRNAHRTAELVKQADWVILAGFLWLVPQSMLEAYPDRIINIHPALLPNYGGKGMYGHHVHEAVVANHEKESGITIHIVDQHYDRGTTLFQARCTVDPDETPDSLAAKIHLLEKEYFPRVIDETIKSRR